MRVHNIIIKLLAKNAQEVPLLFTGRKWADVRHVAEIIIFEGQCCTGRYAHAAHGDVFVLILNQYGSCCLRRRGYLLIQPMELMLLRLMSVSC